VNSYQSVEEWLHIFLLSALDERKWTTSLPATLTPRGELAVPVGEEAGWAPEPAWTLRRRK
jgi:hypothetical protein